ncbi:MAG: hypothetical protein J6W80_00890 [Kiritimatiellae bacterium]|nr:hypothetical protein [Kiritimatiellia bacterium]
MKNILKTAVAAIALAGSLNLFADKVKDGLEPEEGVVGWTPIAIGLATPIQLPYGLNRWDVHGIDLNLFYSDAPEMIGVDIGGLASVVRQDMYGAQFGGFVNFNCCDVYGMRLSLGLNWCGQTANGFDFGFMSFGDRFRGVEFGLLGTVQHNVSGVALAGLANVTDTQSYGCTLALGANLARVAYGLQGSIFFNMTEELHGAQIGFVNWATECPSGFQIGLVNIILDNRIKVLPFVNGFF